MSKAENDRILEQPNVTTDSELDPLKGAYFPRRYLTDFYRFMTDHPDLFELITYADLAWDGDEDHTSGYPGEFSRWQQKLKRGALDAGKIYVLIQYDIDSRPERMLGLLQDDDHQKVPTNIMVFNRRIDRRHLKASGEVRLTDYNIDYNYLKRQETSGSQVGYHSNSYELSGFDMAQAEREFASDVQALRQHFNLRFFSPHGGVADAAGLNNRDVPLPQELKSSIKWVANGYTPKFHGHFSDGGHNSQNRDPADRDLHDFISKMKPGGRYRVLLHPQYYDLNPGPSPRFAGTPWYDAMMERYQQDSQSCLLPEDVMALILGNAKKGASNSPRPARKLSRIRKLMARPGY